MASVPYNGVISEFVNGDDVLLNSSATDKFKAMTGLVYTKETNDTYTKYFSLNAGITKFRVYIWVEGQDVDCENDASGSKVSYNIQLSMDDGSGN